MLLGILYVVLAPYFTYSNLYSMGDGRCHGGHLDFPENFLVPNLCLVTMGPIQAKQIYISGKITSSN